MSSPPVKYLRYFDFTTYATLNPDKPLPGASVDVEYNRLLTTSNQTIDRLAEIQRDDGKLKDGAITTNSLLDGSVTEPKLATGAVSTRALADGSVTGPKLAAGSIPPSAIQPGSIGSTQLLDGGVQTVDLADGACTLAKLAPNSVDSSKILDGSIAPSDLSPAVFSAFAPAVHPHPQSDVVNLIADLALKAPLASPALTGIPTAPTPATGTNTTQLATTAFVAASMSAAGAITEAPNDGALYGRQSLGWQPGVKLAGDIMTGALQVPSLRLGGATAAFPMLKNNANVLWVRNGDDTANAPISAGAGTFEGQVSPSTTLLHGLGSAALRWLKLFAKDGDFSGDVNIAGMLTAGSINPATLSQIQSNPNKIINGDFRVNQRYGVTSVAGPTSIYTADRWYLQATQATRLQAQTGIVPSIIGAGMSPMPASMMSLTCISAVPAPAGTDFFGLSQAIEGINCVDTLWSAPYARPITLSFWAQSTVAGQYGGAIRNGAANRSYPFAFTIAAASTWQRFAITIPGDFASPSWTFDNGVGMNVGIVLGAGGTVQGVANAWANGNIFQPTGCVNMMATLNARFDITGVKVELGSNATPFEMEDYEESLARCQRYYWEDAKAPATVQACSLLDGGTGDYPTAFVYHPVPMRAAPTGSFELIGTFYYNSGAGSASFVPAAGSTAYSGNNIRGQLIRQLISNPPGAAQLMKSGEWQLRMSFSAEL